MVDRTKRPLVVIADDEDVIRDMLRMRLAREGYDIETAADGAEAALIIDREFVNLVLTDLQMPRLHGMELLRRTVATRPDTAVIIMTGHATLDTAIEACRLGACDYLQKPFEHLDDVAHKVKLALERQRLEFQNRELVRKLAEMNAGLRRVLDARVHELGATRQALHDVAVRGVSLADALSKVVHGIAQVEDVFGLLCAHGDEATIAAAKDATRILAELREDARRLQGEALGGV